MKPVKINDENDENKYNEKFEAKKAKAVRHILLIRHGQYRTDGKSDVDRVLTELGTVSRKFSSIKVVYSCPNRCLRVVISLIFDITFRDLSFLASI